MNYNKIIHKFDTKHFINNPYNSLQIGQLLQLGIKIQEGEKSRIQKYKGILIAKKNSNSTSTIRIRKIFQKVGVERIFPLSSNQIESITILSQNKVRRSKLYFLRSRLGKQSIIKD
uniref:Ribosomal protein L19 n=1 Tax=Derbesia sp. WEST4838 TaxID=1847751 RepID=A0A1C9JBE2_9CHLO|nr:ribosomal protein L19 [Derbesia sp. WEST4838]AOP19169.1 ribosomal protein L19 [Derbesia sp. WEST4838]